MQYGLCAHCERPLELDAETMAPLKPICCLRGQLEWAKVVLLAIAPHIKHPLDTRHSGYFSSGLDSVADVLDAAILVSPRREVLQGVRFR